MIPFDSLEPEPIPELDAADLALVGQLTSSTSHRINNLLHRIGGGEILVDEGIQGVDIGKISRGWSLVKPAQARIRMLMTNLLFFSQPFQPYRRSVRLDQTIEQVEDNLSDAFNRPNFDIQNELPARFSAELDSYHTAIAIQNIVSAGLVGNDGKDPNEECRVELAISQTEKGLSFRFKLIAIDQSINLRTLLDRDVKTQGGERGKLELLVARKIVEAQGGSIDVAPAVQNVTIIQVVLPAN